MTPLRIRRKTDSLSTADPWIEFADRSLYIVVAVLFLAAAVMITRPAVVRLFQHLKHPFVDNLIQLINNLLLVLIILEVLGTVRNYLERGATSLRPFLYIGIISASRRILAIGAQSSLPEAHSDDAFRHLMIDLGVNGAVVLALALALYLFGSAGGDEESDEHAPVEHSNEPEAVE